jgi:hypothetical protein
MTVELVKFIDRRWVRGRVEIGALQPIGVLLRIAASMFAVTEWGPITPEEVRAQMHEQLDRWVDEYQRQHRAKGRAH